MTRRRTSAGSGRSLMGRTSRGGAESSPWRATAASGSVLSMMTQRRGARAWAVAGMMMAACGGEAAPTAPPPPPVTAEPEVPPEPQPTVVMFSAATFADSRLQTCLDVTVSVQPGHEPDGGVGAFVSNMESQILSGDDIRRITRPCTQQFSDRTEWASCTLPVDRGGVLVSFTERYLDFGRAFGDDHFMQECIGREGGDWRAVSRDTPEWQRANREHQLESLQRDAREGQAEIDRLLSRRARR